MSKHIEILSKGAYRVRFSRGPKDLAATRALRTLCFKTDDTDFDEFDATCSHILIEDIRFGELACCFRTFLLSDGSPISNSYSAQFYDLSRLANYPKPMLEVGRFCVDPTQNDPDILRLAWAALTHIVANSGVQMLFGCSSFAGTEGDRHLDAFGLLQRRYLAPEQWRPQAKAPNLFRFDSQPQSKPDTSQAILSVPPLLRSYLMMGGWVSDHAVVDKELNTLHVFTGLEIGAIPESRQRLLRGMADVQ